MPPTKTTKTTSAPEADDDIIQPKGAQFTIFSAALKAFEKDVDGGTRKMLSCTASSTIEDLHGDRMTTDCVMGMAPQAKAKGMTIFLNHSYKVPEDVFGKTTDAKIVQRTTDADGKAVYDLDLEIMLDESNERAMATYASIKDQGIKLGVSIGAIIEDYEFIDEEEGWWGGLEIKSVNLLEASIVGIPANQRSWVINGLVALGAPKGIINKALGKDVPKTPALTSALVAKDIPVVSKLMSVDHKYILDGVDVTDQVTVVSTTKELDPKTGEELPDTEVEASTAPETETTEESETTADEDDSADETKGAKPSLADATSAVATLKSSGVDDSLLEILLGFLEGATEEVASLRNTVKDLTNERDQARQDVEKAAEIVETIARTPIGRKAQFAAPVDDFRTRFAGYYGEGYLALLDEENDPE